MFRNTEEATQYVRAVAKFDELMWYIAEHFDKDRSEAPDESKRKAVCDFKLRIEQEGLRPVLENIPGLIKFIRFLDMSPEEVVPELARINLSES